MIEQDHVLERQFLPGTRFLQDLQVICARILLKKKQRLHPRFAQHETKFMRPIRGIDVDQQDADLCGRHLKQDPLSAVRCPDPDAVARPDSQRPQTRRHVRGLVRQLLPGVTNILLPRHERQSGGVPADRLLEHLRNSLVEERERRPLCIRIHDQQYYRRGQPPG